MALEVWQFRLDNEIKFEFEIRISNREPQLNEGRSIEILRLMKLFHWNHLLKCRAVLIEDQIYWTYLNISQTTEKIFPLFKIRLVKYVQNTVHVSSLGQPSVVSFEKKSLISWDHCAWKGRKKFDNRSVCFGSQFQLVLNGKFQLKLFIF